jgi:hypothetical protein
MSDEQSTGIPEQQFIVRIEIFAGHGCPTADDIEMSHQPVVRWQDMMPLAAPSARQSIVAVDFIDRWDRCLAIPYRHGNRSPWVTPNVAKDALLREAQNRWNEENATKQGPHWVPWGMRLERSLKPWLRESLQRLANSSMLDTRSVSKSDREGFLRNLEYIWRPPAPWFPPEEIAAVKERILLILNEHGSTTGGEVRKAFPDLAWWVVYEAVRVGMEEGLWHYVPEWRENDQLIRLGPHHGG